MNAVVKSASTSGDDDVASGRSGTVVHAPWRAGLSAPAEAPIRIPHTLHDRPQISAILYRESARCERTGHEFSLVVFDLSDLNAELPMGQLLQDRARATDEVGWFNDAQLCAVLPDTGAAGARHFVAGVTRRARTFCRHLSSTIYTYPGAWNEKHPSPQSGSMDLSGRGIPRSNDGAMASEMPPAPIEHGPEPMVIGLEPLLVRDMPLWKRFIDIAVSGTCLLLASPLMLVVAALIRLTSSGPVLFTQKRAGLGGRPFTIYKFRTMIANAEGMKAALRARSEQDGPAFKMSNDPRITRVGRILRETSLDELPQLINVLKGDMSLVGPRPLPVEEAEACEMWHRRRLDVTPGLTCIWQVKGRSRVSFADWVRMDRRYIRTRSLVHDIRLMVQTVPAVLLRRGAK